MSVQYPMKCRYGDGCGDFANGVALRHHYDDNHPDYVPTTKRGTCSLCGQSLSRASFNGHLRAMHSRTTGVEFIVDGRVLPPRALTGQSNRSGWCTMCGVSVVRKNTARHVTDAHGIALEYGEGVRYWTDTPPSSNVVPMRPVDAALAVSASHHPSAGRAPEPDRHLSEAGLTADEICIPAIEVLAMPGNMVPVSALAALFLWRDQTAAMLGAVTGAR